MKTLRILLIVWLVILPFIGLTSPIRVYAASFGQAATFPTQPQCTLTIGPTATTQTGGWINLGQANCQDVHYWTMTWIALLDVGTIPTCQGKLEQTGDKSTVTDLIANQACSTSGTTSSATLQTSTTSYVRLNLGTKSGVGTVIILAMGYRQNPFGSVNVTPSGAGATEPVNVAQIAGQSTATNGNGVIAVAGAASSGLIVTTAACSGSTCYTAPVMSGVVTVASGSTSTIFATTTQLTGGHCNNSTLGAVTMTLTDGNNAFVGWGGISGGFSIPASSFMDLPPGLIGHVFTNGVRASANTASAVICSFNGKQ